MRVYSVNINRYSNNNTVKRQHSAINFDGRTINGHYYTDREYIDAMNHKDRGFVTTVDFMDNYGFFEYVFTEKPEKHVKEVNKCIEDIKAEERRAKEAHEARLREIERERQRVQAQLDAIKKQQQQQKQTIDSYIEFKDGEGLKSCNLSEENLEILKDEVLRPVGESKLNKTGASLIPNGVLIAGEDESQNKKIITELARKILQEDFPHSFKEVQYVNPERFQEVLETIKNNASTEYKNNGKQKVIYIPGFDNIAKFPGTENYSPSLNSFLKVYFLDCAENGCIILASAIDKDNIEPPFLINSERFKVIVDI